MTNAYDYIKNNIRANLHQKMIDWRKENVIVKVDKPTDIGKARMLGYKDKKGFIVVRVRLKRGGHKRSPIHHNRRSVRQTVRKNLVMNYREIAESRAQKRYSNLEVLNSYKLAKDGVSYFFEVIMVDPRRAEIFQDKNISWIVNKRKRALRGLTFAGKKSKQA